jgi:hypothetical protein
MLRAASAFADAADEHDAAAALLFDALCDGAPDDAAAWSGADAPPLGAEAWAACCAGSDAGARSAPGASLHLFRCLDGAHGPGPCGGCAPPPAEGQEGDYELLLDGSGARGQKRLRALLCRTREWNSAAARAQLAALCDASAGLSTAVGAASHLALAAALRAKRSAALTKPQMMRMARAWGYASDLWRRHGRASRKRMAACEAPASDHHDAETSVEPRSTRARLHAGGFAWGAALSGADLGAGVTPEAVAAEEASQLTPLAHAAAALLSGPTARAAASLPGACAYFGGAEVCAVSAARDAFGRGAAAWATAAPAVPAAGDAGDAPPWRALRGRETDAEVALRALAETLRRAANANCAARYFAAPEALRARRASLEAAMTADAAGFDPAAPNSGDEGAEEAFRVDLAEVVPPAQAGACAAWLREAYAGLVALAELCVRLQALLADAKLARHWAAFAAADAAARRAAAMACGAARDALDTRLAWMAEALHNDGGAALRDDDALLVSGQRLPLFAFPASARLPAPPGE